LPLIAISLKFVERIFVGNSLLFLIEGAMKLQICPVGRFSIALVLMHRKSESNYSISFSTLGLYLIMDLGYRYANPNLWAHELL